MRRVLWLPLLLLVGCDGCGSRKADELPPASVLPKNDELVFDLPTTALVDIEARFAPLVKAIITEPQRKQLGDELTMALGFDPTTAVGLSSAGLDLNGRWAGSFRDDEVLLAVPTQDLATAKETVADALERRFGTAVPLDGGMVRFDRSFGPETIEAAALGQRGRLLLVAFGERASARVGQARSLAAADGAAGLLPGGSDDLLRVRTPDPKRLAERTLDSLPPAATAGLDREKVDLVLASVRRSALDLRWVDDGLRLSAESAFEGAEAIDPYVEPIGPVPPALSTLVSEEAIISLRLALGPDAIFDALLPPNSPGRQAIDKARAEGKLRLDFEQDVLPLLSGHLGIALGASDLREVPFRQIVGDPLSVSWMGIGVGTKEGADLMAPFAAQMAADSRVKVKTRTVGERQVSSFLLGETRVVEAAETSRALLFGTDQAVMDRVLTAEAKARTAVPFELSLRFDPLEEVARSFPGSKLPLVFRGLWARTLDGIAALQSLEARVVREADTVQLTIDLSLNEAEATKDP
ncbi:MAG: hypothetical protein AAGD10_00955 [Myxococcota bacterium]